MKNKMINPSYFSDMQIVDERLTKLERDYAKIIKLLNDLAEELSKVNGGKENGKQKEFDKSCKRQTSI